MDNKINSKILKYDQLKKCTEGIKRYINLEDEILNNKLTAEETSRKASDGVLGAKIEELIATLATIDSALKSIDASLNSIREDLDTEVSNRENALGNLENSLNSTINDKVDNAISSIPTVKWDENIFAKNEDGEITLGNQYTEELNDSIYNKNKPTISEFNFNGNVTTSCEFGSKVTISGFKHKETNLSNI
jgi:hypothetical protein